jgi:MarR family transcriptional regulator, 2-MHQ and catechol-resistance regulon repressor
MPTHFKGSKSEVRALNAFINLQRATDSVSGRISAQLDERGVTIGQFGVLEALLHLGPLCQYTLAEKLLRSGGNVTVVVDNLEKHGLVRRERQQDDRRMVVIHLTPAGKGLIQRIFPAHAKAITEEMNSLAPREQDALRRICRKLGRGGAGEVRPAKQRKKKEQKHVTDSIE